MIYGLVYKDKDGDTMLLTMEPITDIRTLSDFDEIYAKMSEDLADLVEVETNEVINFCQLKSLRTISFSKHGKPTSVHEFITAQLLTDPESLKAFITEAATTPLQEPKSA